MSDDQQNATQVTQDQVRAAAASGLEVLNGTSSDRVLAQMDQLQLCRIVLRGIASGELMIAQAQQQASAENEGDNGNDSE